MAKKINRPLPEDPAEKSDWFDEMEALDAAERDQADDWLQDQKTEGYEDIFEDED